MCHTLSYCRCVARKSVGSVTRSSDWEVAGSSFDDRGSTGSVFFISDERPGLWLSLTLVLDGRDVTERVVGFEVRRQHPEQPTESVLSARLLRSVTLGRLAREAMRELRNRADRAADPRFWRDDPAGQEQAILKALALRSESLGPRGRPGRRGHPDQYYARLAVDYEVWQRTGECLATLAKREHLSASALRAALGTARRRGLLTSAPPGRAGGKATEIAKVLLHATAKR